mmetsp:Transcript_23618/g.52363  ORF Transcript_23618/g.52363 Transcript_23618/m.52363 type:complete len:137 (+) Transcript_23618:63-473(+)
MSRCLVLAALFLAAVPTSEAGTVLRQAPATADSARSSVASTVADQVYVDGSLFAEGSAAGEQLGCHEHQGTSSFKVCGCNVKVVAHLFTECQKYQAYDETVGTCDCSKSGCDEKTLTSGYSKEFEWKAASFEIVAC